MKTEKTKNIIKNLVLVLLTTILIFAVAEYSVRKLVRPIAGYQTESDNNILQYELIPGYSVKHRGWEISINSRGFRDKEYPLSKPENAYRIVVLGDSITFGGAKPEQTYTEVVEGLLNDNKEGRIYEVINAGVSGYGMDQYLERLKRNCLILEPDLLIIGLCLNDIYSQVEGGVHAYVGEVKTPLLHKAKQFLRKSSLLKLLAVVYNRTLVKTGLRVVSPNYRAYCQENIRLYRPGEKNWQTFKAIMEEIRALSEKANFEVAILVFPFSIQIYDKDPDLSPQRLIKEASREKGFYCLDLRPVYFSYKDKDIFVLGDPLHPNPAGHRIAAEHLYRFLKQYVFTSTKPPYD